MNINELFDKLQDNFGEELNGNLELDGNCIIWSYSINDYIDSLNDVDFDDEENDDIMNESLSEEEILLEKYGNDYEKIQEFFDKMGNMESWYFSDSDILDNIISFKIF